MDESPEIRFATAEDAALLAQMLHDFNTEFGDPSPGPEVLAPRVAAVISSGEMTYLLGGNEVDGFAQISFRPSVWSDGPVAYLEELYVKPDRRRQGTGQALMEAILDEARRRGAERIELGTGEDDFGARALYEKFGFRNEFEGENNARALFYELNL
ncbi:MAG: GNAT family N-acetyltransferase [Solirubrobacterales bacterium]